MVDGTIGCHSCCAYVRKKVMTMKLILIFFGVVTTFIILSGLLFNLIL